MDYVSAPDHSTAVGLVNCFISLKSVAALSKCKIMIKSIIVLFELLLYKASKNFPHKTVLRWNPSSDFTLMTYEPSRDKKVPLCDLPPSWWTSLNAILEKSLIKLLLSWILSILNLHPQCYPNFISDQKVRHASSHNQSQTAGQDFPHLC